MTHFKAADAALLIIALAIVWSLYRAHKDKNGLSNFNLFDLLMENGRVSKVACAFMTTLGVTSWIMIRLTLDGKISDGYFAAYGAMWVAPIVVKLFSPVPASTVTATEITRTTSQTTTPAPLPAAMTADTVNVQTGTTNVTETPKGAS